MNEWLISIVGIVFLGVLIDLIAPSGKTNKFIKSIFGVFVIFVIAYPIFTLLTGNLDFNFFKELELGNSDYFASVNSNRLQSKQLLIEDKLEKRGIVGVNITLCGNIYDSDFFITKVMCDIKNLVLNEKITHINKYDNITNVILEVISIDKGIIEFYE